MPELQDLWDKITSIESRLEKLEADTSILALPDTNAACLITLSTMLSMLVYESGMTEPMIARIEKLLSEEDEASGVSLFKELGEIEKHISKNFILLFLQGLKSFRGVDPTS